MITKKAGKGLFFVFVAILGLVLVYGWAVLRTRGRTVIQFDISQNLELIQLSAYSNPPQFAIWIENPETGSVQTVFVTYRAGVGDWKGKAHVPVALPRWFELFKSEDKEDAGSNDNDVENIAVAGATPREDHFSMLVEVPPGSKWICWIEMNLSGDYNDAFPELDLERDFKDEFGCGQPALLYKAEIVSQEGLEVQPELFAQSVWEDGINRVEPVSDGVTTAKHIFEAINLRVMRPKPKLIDNL